MADARKLQLTRRAFRFGAGALASSAALGIGRARAQPATCVVGTWGGDYQNPLDANILQPLLEPNAVHVQWAGAGGTPSDFEPGKKKLREFKKLGVRVLPSNEAMAQALQSGEVWITPMWRARCVQWQNAGIPVANVAPAEGAIPILFEFGVPKNPPHKQGADPFLHASLEPAAQIGFAQKMGYAPTVANAQLPPEH